MKNVSWKQLFYRYIPLIIVIIASIFSAYTLFFSGINGGDDRVFHLAQIEDLYLGFTKGQWGLSTNHTFFGIFALDNYGYYGPFPHYFAALTQFIFSGWGANSIGTYKFTIMAFTIVSGIFTYLLAMEISKKNRVLSTICAVFYIFLPYRMFCATCRQAYSETIALSFIPVIFYGAYRIVNDDKYSVMPYMWLILGAVLMILSHPFSALMTAIFGVLFIIFNLGKIIKENKWKRISLNLAISALLIFSLVGFYVTLALHTSNMNVYRLNDANVMWMTFEHVRDSTLNSATFSGFLNFIWIMGTSYTKDQTSLIIFGLVLYFICFALMVIADYFIKKLPKSKYYRYPLDLVALFLVPAIFWQRAEFYIGLFIGYCLFVFISIFASKERKDQPKEENKLYKNPDIYFVLVGIIFCLIFIFIGDAWKILPSIFYSCQFAWRLFGFLYFFLFYLVIIVINELKTYRYTYAIAGVLASFFVLLSMPLLEKREAYKNDINIYQVADEEWLKTITYSGAQNEMVPNVFYNDSYKSEYTNSLYSNVYYRVRTYSRFVYTMEDYIAPAFLTGKGNLTITSLSTPNATFQAEVLSETALVQLPQFYEDGYYAYFNNERVSGENIDGLVSFNLPKGTYELKVTFERTNTFKVFAPIFYVGIGLTVAYVVGGTIYKYKKEKNSENN